MIKSRRSGLRILPFRRVFTELHAMAILGQREFEKAANEIYNFDIKFSSELKKRVNKLMNRLVELGFDPERGLLDVLAEKLKENGFESDANHKWMDKICELLKMGYSWKNIL